LFGQNALRAVVEYHGAEDALPNLRVLICRGRKDVTIKVSTITLTTPLILLTKLLDTLQLFIICILNDWGKMGEAPLDLDA